MNTIERLDRYMRENRKRALAYRVCDALRGTLRIQGITTATNTDDVRVEFTDDSLAAIGSLVEAIDILEAIVWASDGCRGHHDCLHSMEPWQRARALLGPKWKADADRYAKWPVSYRGFAIYQEPAGWYGETDGGTCLGPFNTEAEMRRAVDADLLEHPTHGEP